MQTNSEKRQRRHKRIRAKICGTAERPRLCIFRSNQYIYAQLVDDNKGRTLIAAKGKANIDSAKKVGKLIAKTALENKIEKIVFDRGGYKYHGVVKALAEEARGGGLKF
ncbi:MAG: 50S ribosomal protein L18 [Candidatus Nealsonbacteria bacterium]|nr:50S ribosomal protein L18 [Candidatus Nealsonbacteria bacterium]